MKSKLEAQVRRGVVRLNAVRLLVRTSKSIVLLVDCVSKYPEVREAAVEKGALKLVLGAGSRTLRTSTLKRYRKRPTTVRMELPGDWHAIADVNPYSIILALFQRDATHRQLWPLEPATTKTKKARSKA